MPAKTEELEMGLDEEETRAQRRERGSIMVHITPEFKEALKEAADEQDVPLVAFVRQTLADRIGFTGKIARETRRVRKYASEEERHEAQKARSKARRDLIKQLLEKYGDELKGQTEEA